MNRIVMIALLIVVVFIVSCGKTQFVCPDGTTVSDPDLCPSEEETVTKRASKPPETTPEPKKEFDVTIGPLEEDIPENIEKLFAKKSKVKSMSYDYREGKAVTGPKYRVYIKGNIIKIELPVKTDILYQNELDVVIFNTAEKSAVGYCESRKYCKEVGEQGEVDYDLYYKDTPFDWLDKVRSAEKVQEIRLLNRNTWRLQINEEFTYWVDAFYGVPLKITKGESLYYIYNRPLFNGVGDEDIKFSEKDEVIS